MPSLDFGDNESFHLTVKRPLLYSALPACLAALLSSGAARAQDRGDAGPAAVVNLLELAREEAARPPAPARRSVPAPLRLPARRWSAAAASRETSGGVASAGAVAAAPSYSGFAALAENYFYEPPDTAGAVGPEHLVTFLNPEMQVQDRTGTVLTRLTLDTFWARLGPFQDVAFDPRVLYDAAARRWIASSAVDMQRPTAAVLVGVSQTADPTGNWSLFRIDLGSTGSWADYPVLGFNGQWVVVSVNLFQILNGNYLRTNIYAFDKATMYGGSRAPYAVFSATDGTLVPAMDYDGLPNRLLLVQAVRIFNGNALELSEITGNVGAEKFSPLTALIPVTDYWADTGNGDADFAPQRGTQSRLDTGDSRLQNCVYRAGSLWCAHTIFLPAGAPTRSAAQWWQVKPAPTQASPNAWQLVQRGRVDDPTGKYFYAYPSIALNRSGDALMGFSRFSASEYPSAAFAFRAAADPAGTMQPEVVFKAGEAFFTSNVPTATSNRWGDFSTTWVDPVDDHSFWTIQEYAATPPSGWKGRWATWWAHVVPPSSGQGCTYSLSAQSQLFSAVGGTGTVAVTAPAGCTWTAVASVPWVTVNTGASGSGSGTVRFTVAASASTAPRTGSLLIAGQTFTITQSTPLPDLALTTVAAPPSALAGGQVSLSITLTNQGGARAGAFRIGFYWAAASAVSAGDIPGGNCTVPGLDAGATLTGTCAATVPAALQPGLWYVAAIADDLGALVEADRSNNTGVAGPVVVLGVAPRPVNAAGYQAGALAPGEMVTLFGPAIGPFEGLDLRLTSAGLVDTTLGGTRVLFDGVPAPMIYAQAAQVSVVVPFGVAGQLSTQVQIEYQGVRSAPLTVGVATAAPAFFTRDASGRGEGAFLNQDYSVNSPAQPAARGSVVMLYATGLGQIPLRDGEIPTRAIQVPQSVTVRIGGIPAEVQYAGSAPSLVAGVYQVNARVPDGVVLGGAVPVEIAVDGVAGPAGATLAVQ